VKEDGNYKYNLWRDIMDISIIATIGFTVIAVIGIIIVYFASCRKG
jgi:hypothetical protein